MANDQSGSNGFGALSRAYKSDPTIENYVALRRRHPTEEIEVAVSGGLEWLFDNQETLRQFDISPDLVASALDANEAAISDLCLKLLERIIARKQAMKSGKSHVVSRKLAIGDELVNFLINLMLDALDWNDDLFIPRDLIVLIRHQTGGGTTGWDQRQEQQGLRQKSVQAALHLISEGKTPTIREIAKALDVNATTVMRWFPKGELAKMLADLAASLTKLRQADRN